MERKLSEMEEELKVSKSSNDFRRPRNERDERHVRNFFVYVLCPSQPIGSHVRDLESRE